MHKFKPEDVLTLRDQREKYYRTLHDQQREYDNYYELVYKVGLPEAYASQQVTPSTARDWIDAGVNLYTMDKPTAYVAPLEATETFRKSASIQNMFYNFWLRKMILQIKENAKKLLLRGNCFFELWIDDEFYGVAPENQGADFEKRRKLSFPLKTFTPDSLNVYPSPASSGFHVPNYIKSYKMTVAEIKLLAENNKWKWKTDKPDDEMVEWISFYSDEYRCFLLDGKPVLHPAVQPNILKFCPMVQIVSGLGQESYEGKPEYLARSILYRKKGEIDEETQLISQVQQILSDWAYPRPIIHGDKAAVEKAYPDGLDMNPQNPLHVPTGTEVEFRQGQQPPPALFQHLISVQESARVPAALAGQRPTGVYSGVGNEIAVSHAKPIYKAPFKNLEDGLAVFLGMGARVLETVLKYPIMIRSPYDRGKESSRFTISPSDINGYYECEVKLLAEPPEATDARKTLGSNMQNSNSMSKRRNLIEYQDLSADEADEEIAQMAAENIQDRNPLFAMAQAREAAKLLGMTELQREIEGLIAQQQIPEVSNPEGRPRDRNQPTAQESLPQRATSSPELESVPTPHEARGLM